jgi:hypothetical protein
MLAIQKKSPAECNPARLYFMGLRILPEREAERYFSELLNDFFCSLARGARRWIFRTVRSEALAPKDLGSSAS